MIVQHNLTAMNSNRMLGITTKSQAKSTEKLSSGYKINRAADDAAGLSISEKMRKQIRGLTQASLNAQDGISAVQTAEGALTEVHDMLQRMNELAVKAANGTNSKDDRGYIQSEVDQLISEIDRVANTTKFNETYLLMGDSSVTPEAKPQALDEATIKAGKEFVESYKISSGNVYIKDGKSSAVITLDTSSGATTVALYLNSDGTVKEGYQAYSVSPSGALGSQTSTVAIANVALKVQATGLMDKDGKEVTQDQLKNFFDEYGVYQGGLYSTNAPGITLPTEIGDDKIAEFVDRTFKDSGSAVGALTLSLHVGADGDDKNKISLDIESMSASGIGVTGLKVDTEAAATKSIETLKDAIKKVSEQRSALGAIQNRLEHTINNLDNVVENTTSAEAQIRDTDMATEMVKYSNNNILAQAGQAMLAQSNQANQGVLSLLG